MATFKFTVEGSGEFPAYLLDSGDTITVTMDTLSDGPRQVKIMARSAPAADKWAATGWPVVELAQQILLGAGGDSTLQAGATVSVGHGGHGAAGQPAEKPARAATVELGPDGKEWAKTMAGYAHVDSMISKADGCSIGPYWYGWALRGAFVAGAEWQEARK